VVAMTVDNNQGTPTSWDELPATITNYLTAHESKDADTAILAFTADAVVTDEGHTYRGRDNISDWLVSAASGFTFTTEFVGATRDSVRIDVVQHLEGDFPGGIADLHFRFTMHGARISRLVIEP
jgi:ketosteroid isomerase-like protein